MNDDPAGRSKGAVGPMEVLAFWRAAGPDKWFGKHPDIDAEIASRFAATWEIAAAGALAQWEDTPEGALARAVATRALERGFDRRISHDERQFLYLPFMHSENSSDQERCRALARGYGSDTFTKFAEHHADIIRRFGRFPHRNAILGRTTTAEEAAFLEQDDFRG